MSKLILYLLYYGLLTIAVGGQINSDPAPGRSPGPPNIDTIHRGQMESSVDNESPTLRLAKDDSFESAAIIDDSKPNGERKADQINDISLSGKFDKIKNKTDFKTIYPSVVAVDFEAIEASNLPPSSEGEDLLPNENVKMLPSEYPNKDQNKFDDIFEQQESNKIKNRSLEMNDNRNRSNSNSSSSSSSNSNYNDVNNKGNNAVPKIVNSESTQCTNGLSDYLRPGEVVVDIGVTFVNDAIEASLPSKEEQPNENEQRQGSSQEQTQRVQKAQLENFRKFRPKLKQKLKSIQLGQSVGQQQNSRGNSDDSGRHVPISTTGNNSTSNQDDNNSDDGSSSNNANDNPEHGSGGDSSSYQSISVDIELDVTHDKFDTGPSLTCGLMYKVRLSSVSSTTSEPFIVKDFFVETTSKEKSRGNFIGYVLSNKLPMAWFKSSFVSETNWGTGSTNSRKSQLWDEEDDDNTLQPSDQYLVERERIAANSSTSSSNDPICSENTWTGNLKDRTEVFAFWLINEHCDRDEVVDFRVFFRIASNHSDINNLKVYKKTFQFRVLKECQLLLKESTGSLDYMSLPLYNMDCLVYFPSQDNDNDIDIDGDIVLPQPPGLLIQLVRLNVPCDSGGYIRLSENIALCGKLEELNDSERTFHFNMYRNISVKIHKYPQFSINYKLVDYCYNMTLMDRNGSFFMQPIRETLECYFRIHLPYGNKIDLTLITNNNYYNNYNNKNNPNLTNNNNNNNRNINNGDLNKSDKYTNSNNNNNNNNENFGVNFTTHTINLSLVNSKSNTNNNININNNYNNKNNKTNIDLNKNESNSHYDVNINEQINADSSAVSSNSGSSSTSSRSGSGSGRRSDGSSNISNTINGRISTNTYYDNYKCDDGLLVRIYDNNLYKWSYCIREKIDRKKFTMVSLGNTLVIHVVKKSLKSVRSSLSSATASWAKNDNRPKPSAISTLPSLYFRYSAKPITAIVSDCAFGWVAVQQFCITAVEIALQWGHAEQECINRGGHLASIRSEIEQKTIDQLLLNSPSYKDHFAYWVGASDKNFEGDFRWTDGLPFLYSNWFPGWSQHGHYNKQPNDDGLSGQDCVELRRHFLVPPGVQATKTPLSNTFMWNDRDCNAKNFFICERPMSDEPIEQNWANDCNKTISLTKEHPRASLWSPSFPRQYPDNANCYTTVTAPSGYRIVLEFEELVIENEPGCSYDYLEITEPSLTHSNLKSTDPNFSHTSRHGLRKNTYRKRNSYDSLNINDNMETAQANYQNLLNIFSNLYKPRSNFLIQTPDYPRGNPLYNTNRQRESLPRRMCGDWSSKLKLLRHVSTGSYLGLHFVSDYSHHYGGFKAKVFMENTASECSDERLKPYNGSCYLFVSYPEVDWWTAQQVCRGIGAQLSSVSSPDEHRFITTSIRNQADYSPQLTYWLGGELSNGKQYEWTDDSKMEFQGWLPGQGQIDDLPNEAMCLGLQWKMSPTPMLPSGLYWESQKCRRVGGYVCKKRKQPFDQIEVKNETLNGVEGRLTTPGYPNPYPSNIDYWIHIVAPERSRIVVQFQKIDLESQDECLYDYVSVQNYETVSEILLEPGTNPIPMAMLTSDKDYDHDVYYENDRIARARQTRSVSNSELDKDIMRQIEIQSEKKNSLEKRLKRAKRPLPIHGATIISNRQEKASMVMKKNFRDGIQMKRKRRKKRIKEYRSDFGDKYNKYRIRRSPEFRDIENGPSFLPYVRWCGTHDANMTKFDFVSASNELLLNFHSDYSVNGLGFSAIWKAIDISGCPFQTLTAREGTVMSANYPYFLINNLDCTFVIQAPIGRKVWLEFTDFDVSDEVSLSIDIGHGIFQPFISADHLNEGMFVSFHEQIRIHLQTGQNPKGRGFHATYKTVNQGAMERILNLKENSTGHFFHLNYPQRMPGNVHYIQHLVAPLGDVILLELYGVEFGQNGCPDHNTLEVYDNYADNNGTRWKLCKFEPDHKYKYNDTIMEFTDLLSSTTTTSNRNYLNHGEPQQAPVYITSYLNTLHIRQRTSTISNCSLNATVRIHQDLNYKLKLVSNDDSVESCQPNPCQFDGKCISNGKTKKCQCKGHYTGRFCGLTICELEPCLFGKCELTPTNFKCHCQPGYVGTTCEQKRKPCADNPCEGRGECLEKNGGFFCRCYTWWEGQRCERRMMHIPYKPLSERMLQEPFWLGLITVFVVLAVIGLVWCAKRHFPEKIEKLLAEEADRNRPGFHGHHHHTSLREQLQFTTSIPQTTATTPGAPRSIFNRLGIRKPSILSLSSPNPPGGATARTFSLDDLLRPPPRRSPSPRKKRNNSTPTKKNAAEKKQILQHLVSPANPQARPKMSLDELMQMSDNRLKAANTIDSESDLKETTFSENSNSASTSTTRPILADPKFEKKVTFARLLSKVSAEMSSGSEVDVANGTRNSSATSLPAEIQYRPNSVPPSPCTNDIRSPHSTSSNPGSDSLSSSDLALTDIGLRNLQMNNNRRGRAKVSSADSILAMFRNFASTGSVGGSVPNSSIFISPSNTPTPTSPQDDVPGDDESSTSSMHTPVSFSSGPPDSPVFYRQSTIEVPVLDALSAHKTTTNANLLHPPTILLEIPSNGINKCLSPIRELPTPMPSPALTPIMPRPQRNPSMNKSMRDDPLSGSYSDDEHDAKVEAFVPNRKAKIMAELHNDINRLESEVNTPPTDTTITCVADMNKSSGCYERPRTNSLVANITIDIDPPTPEERASRPKDLIIPKLTIEQPSPTKDRLPMIIFPGSPPPQRASIGETSFMFPNKQQQKRLLKQFEKPTSLDLPFAPPMITVTSNMSELESDAEPMSPAPNKMGTGTTLLVPGGAVGMCYLSPFAICTRADRTISESNLSSSGYSSMASPGPSRCGSSNPLCPNEMDESGNGPPGNNLSLHANLLSRRQSTLLASCKENVTNGKTTSSSAGTHERLRGRSDSETLSDDALLESNDEGIGTDHLDEKVEEGESKNSKEPELFVENDLIETGKNILSAEETVAPMSQLQLPSIVIQSDGSDKGLSPVSSRSESPLSERAGMGRFSPHFYGKKDQQLPFTDSDGLYDFPSSDGKGTSVVHQRRSSGKKRERKSPRIGVTQSPTRNHHLDLPTKDQNATGGHVCSKHFHHHHHPHHGASTTTRKSPKRRPVQRHPVPSSSSSSDSLTSARELTLRAVKSTGGSPNREQYLLKYDEGSEDDTGEDVSSQILPNAHCDNVVRTSKISRLRAIGNQIRFLRRLEKSIKKRDKLLSPSDSCPEDGNEELDSPRVTSPLLHATKRSKVSLCRQKRLPPAIFAGIGSMSTDRPSWRSRERNIIHGDINSD